jgi:hypothetical protein
MTNLLLSDCSEVAALIERASYLPRPARHRQSFGRECCGAVPKMERVPDDVSSV